MTQISSNKAAILLQAAGIMVAAALAAGALEYSGLVTTSALGRLSRSVGLPVVGAAVFFIGFAIAIATVVDSWAFTVRFNDTNFEIVDRLGRSKVRYGNIGALKLIPAYGAGIALKDRQEWLNAFAGTDANRAKLERISTVVLGAYGCDIAFVNKRLKGGSRAFLDRLSSKTGLEISGR